MSYEADPKNADEYQRWCPHCGHIFPTPAEYTKHRDADCPAEVKALKEIFKMAGY